MSRSLRKKKEKRVKTKPPRRKSLREQPPMVDSSIPE
jgi:hypothetical protein